MQQVMAYIRTHLSDTFRPANENTPYPFVSPTADPQYKDFYYWDTYFENLGLMLLGHLDYAESDLDNIAYAIGKYGYMPNALVWHSLDRSQPPFFTRMVWSYYRFRGNDRGILERYIDAILREHDFWVTRRASAWGLCSYGCEASGDDLIRSGYQHHTRVQESADTPEGQRRIGRNLLAIAESGLDFNMRFRTADSKIAADRFVHLDLNCILFEAEELTAKMLTILGRNEEAAQYADAARCRRAAVDEHLYDPAQGIYLDRDFTDGSFSTLLSQASLYPYAFGLSRDAAGAARVLARLELPFGVSAAEYRGEDALYFQWDYPCIWPAATLLSYQALARVGLTADARRIAEKYMAVVDKNFEATGRLWEKYDGRDGSVAVTSEYETPPFLGWTAAVYVIFDRELTGGGCGSHA